MLIDFTVSNFRSIRDEATISFVAHEFGDEGRRLEVREVALGRLPGHGFDVLPVAGIFGPNGAGKSNFIAAFGALIMLTLPRAMAGVHLRALVDGFRFEAKGTTKFALRCVRDDIVFAYTLEVDRDRVIFECLDRLLPGLGVDETELLFRRGTDEAEVWQFHDELKSVLIPLSAVLPRDIPLLTQAGTLEFPLLAPFRKWWQELVVPYSPSSQPSYLQGLYELWQSPALHNMLMGLLGHFDLGIDRLEIPTEWEGESEFERRTRVFRRSGEKVVSLSLAEESTGTRAMIAMIGILLSALAKGYLFAADEVESHLHPLLVQTLVELFQNPVTNPFGAQLLFASHETSLLSPRHLRPDQIWFVSKGRDWNSSLYPLIDYELDGVNLEQAYLNGLMGAVPIVQEVGR